MKTASKKGKGMLQHPLPHRLPKRFASTAFLSEGAFSLVTK